MTGTSAARSATSDGSFWVVAWAWPTSASARPRRSSSSVCDGCSPTTAVGVDGISTVRPQFSIVIASPEAAG
ncbi:hypothetical protein, partial [Microbacterium maritypicum]|uniref:hypothetical protein n=1 Tax=Microbacterium maritypicum TaxID=33918 RepID=UPI00296EFC7E